MSEQQKPKHITEAFDLPTARLRDDLSGRWHALRIAEALGVPPAELAAMIRADGAEHEALAAIHHAPDGVDLQERLAPVANILAMVSDYHGGDDAIVRAWLGLPQPRLGGRTPLDALREGHAVAMEQWIAGVWLGEGE